MNKFENIAVYPGIGPVRFVRNRRARNLSIRINRQGDVRVTVPGHLSWRRAESFLRSRQEWIIRKKTEQQELAGTPVNKGDILDIRGKQLQVIPRNGSESMEKTVWRILLPEAKAYLPGRVDLLARKHGFSYSGIRIRGMRSRWGSCSAKQVINLNSWLVTLPDHLSDYVILHELVHTRHKDHGRGFWEALDRVTGGNARALRKELRNHLIMSVHPVEKLNREGH